MALVDDCVVVKFTVVAAGSKAGKRKSTAVAAGSTAAKRKFTVVAAGAKTAKCKSTAVAAGSKAAKRKSTAVAAGDNGDKFKVVISVTKESLKEKEGGKWVVQQFTPHNISVFHKKARLPYTVKQLMPLVVHLVKADPKVRALALTGLPPCLSCCNLATHKAFA
ncbi:unnamed protein product [Chrysoparadoxa australica]